MYWAARMIEEYTRLKKTKAYSLHLQNTRWFGPPLAGGVTNDDSGTTRLASVAAALSLTSVSLSCFRVRLHANPLQSKICIIGAKDVVSRANYTEHWRTLKLFPGCSLKIRPSKANMFPADVLNVLSLKVVWNMQYCKQWYPWLTAESRCGQRRRKLCFDLQGRKI